MSGGRLAEVAAALLVGGASTRMGTDKARVAMGEGSAAAHLASGLGRLFEEVLLVGGDPPADAPGVRVADPGGPRCPLRGVVGALEAARVPRVLVVATDLVGLGPELVLALVAAPQADVVAPRLGGRLEPLCAVYLRETVLPVARARLAAGRLALHELLAELDVTALEGPDLAALDPDTALANANTPEELRAALDRVGAGGVAW